MKILIVEDTDDIYDYYMRFFNGLLPLDGVAIVRVSTLKAASETILEEWDVILMDYQMGESYTVTNIGSADITPVHLQSGAQLIEFHKKYAKGEDAFIIGTSPSKVLNERLVKAGANTSQLKNHVEAIAEEIKRRMN